MKVVDFNKESSGKRTPRVLAITGGKGGVGKSSISVNLGIAMSRLGSKVCLFDADTGLANINVMLGLHPAYNLEHLFTAEKSINDILLEGPEGLHIVPGASGFAQCAELNLDQQRRLVESIRSLEPKYDYMIVDTAAGISPTVLHFVAACQVAAVVITPEPTSLTDAFSLLKVLRRRGYRRKVEVIVNMAANDKQADKVYRRFNNAVDKYLGLKTEYLGTVWMDESMRSAVSLQRPVALFPKDDPSARSFYRIAERIDSIFSKPGVPSLCFSAYWQKLVDQTVALEARKQQAQVAPPSGTHSGELRSSPDVSRPDVPNQELDKPAMVVDLKAGKPAPEMTQVQRQIQSQKSRQLEKVSSDAQEVLSDFDDNEWIELRIRMNRFFTNPNTTPEQVTTLISSCIYAYGDRLGDASVDLMHGLLSTLRPETLSAEQKVLLRAEYQRLGLQGGEVPIVKQRVTAIDNEVIEVASLNVKDEESRYDAEGFGCQNELKAQIQSAPKSVPLENLLESIKYASLVDSSRD